MQTITTEYMTCKCQQECGHKAQSAMLAADKGTGREATHRAVAARVDKSPARRRSAPWAAWETTTSLSNAIAASSAESTATLHTEHSPKSAAALQRAQEVSHCSAQ